MKNRLHFSIGGLSLPTVRAATSSFVLSLIRAAISNPLGFRTNRPFFFCVNSFFYFHRVRVEECVIYFFLLPRLCGIEAQSLQNTDRQFEIQYFFSWKKKPQRAALCRRCQAGMQSQAKRVQILLRSLEIVYYFSSRNEVESRCATTIFCRCAN